ncbi:hypothetical protein KVR01_001109 [Diaporthe batatas]|uniref:uncharacterized protein n=1 Tax=Diaporthe batatas TaxID=748121 RepID=UPI001D03E35E|nr:uncharacterized protein KVR01_001109 [Diaporthe batatas]KAG8168360.1 hypothetical protein KVR01_001109 [Diaporthe batatas]
MHITILSLLLTTFHIQAAWTFKTIPDLEALGYTVRDATPPSSEWLRYDVSYGTTFLADLAIYKDNHWPGLLGVFNAQTDDDDRPDRLPLRDLELGFWVHKVGRDSSDLHSITYMDVYEEALQQVTHRVYELMGKLESENLLIFRDTISENEKKAYDLLHTETPFGSGAQKMTEEFQEMQGKVVGGFGYEAQAAGVFHFTVYFS